MNKLKNLFNIFLGVCFVIWFFQSFYTPMENIFTENSLQSKIYGFATLVIIGFLVTKIIPRISKRIIDPLNYNVGSTKKKGSCSSCKKKKFDP
jgi:hypothetical protein